MKIKNQLLKLIEEHRWFELPKLIKNHGRRAKSKSDLEEALMELNHSQQDFIWKSVNNLFINKYVGIFFEKEHTVLSQDEDSQCFLPESEEECLLIFENILILLSIEIRCLIDDKKQVSTTSQYLTQFVVLIGGVLSEFKNPVHELAVDVCENWIKSEFERHEEILPDTLLAVIEICLQPGGKKKDIERVWMLRGGLNHLYVKISENTEASQSLKEILISCASSSLFLGSENGIKILSFIFLLPNLVEPFHSAVKNRFPYCTKVQSKAYAQIYFRTWKHSQGELKQTLEQNCFQDLMYLAVHADPLTSHLSNNLNLFLHHIHKQKKHLQTATMIYSLYEPFIWRSLKVANGYVRTNAATLLCDLFPCTDMNLPNQERDQLMEKQYQAFVDLLLDPCHHVRIVTVKGVFTILKDFWLLVPSHIIQKIFQIFLNKLIVDASSAEIRMLVVQGITQLLDCPDAGAFITSILPHVAPSFDDINSAVRVSFMKLLLKVKATRFIKYWKLVPMEHLMNRLACDGNTVRSLITKLILSSFLPVHLDEAEIFQRCVTIIEMNRDGARRFYQHAGKTLDLEAAVRFILFTWRTLHRYVQMTNSSQANNSSNSFIGDENENSNLSTNSPPIRSLKRRKKPSPRQEQNKENQGEKEDESEMPLDNPVIVGGLLDTIIILWAMNAPRLSLPQNFKYLEELRTRVARTFPVMWSFFKENDEISKTLLYLSSFLPKSNVSTMVGLCLSRLRTMEEKEELSDYFTTYVNALCNWNRLDDITELISEWIGGAFTSGEKLSNNQSSKKKVRVRFEEKTKPKPLVALQILSHILEHPLNKVCLLQSNRELLIRLCEEMSNVQNHLEKRCKGERENFSISCTDQFLLRCWTDYLCVASLLNYKTPEREIEEDEVQDRRTRQNRSKDSSVQEVETFDSLTLFKKLLNWLDRLSKDDGNESFDNLFYCMIASRFTKAGSDLAAIGIADDEFLKDYLHFMQIFLQKAPFDDKTWCSSFQGISYTHQQLCAYSEGDHLVPTSSISCQAFIASLSILSEKLKSLAVEKNALESLSKAIGSTLQTLSQYSSPILKSVMKQVVKLTLKSIYDQVSLNLETICELSKIKDFNGEAYMLLSSVHKVTKFAETFAQNLKDGIDEFADQPHLVLSVAVLLSVLLNDGGKMSRHSLKEMVQALHILVEETSISNEQNTEAEEMETRRSNEKCFTRAKDLLESLRVSL